MNTRPVNEKMAEILFNRSFLQAFPLGMIELFAPSSVEEYRLGYDAAIVGPPPVRELYLQFKSPEYSDFSERFTITPTPHQHSLLKTYGENHAYYVASMFRSLTELNDAQANLQTASDFLKHFVCIEISRLPDVVNFFHYKWPDTHRSSPNLRFKVPGDGSKHTAIHPITGAGWLRGSTLFEKFRAKEIGAIISSSNADIHQEATEYRMGVNLQLDEGAWEPLSSGAYEHAAHCAPSDYGVMMRQRTG